MLLSGDVLFGEEPAERLKEGWFALIGESLKLAVVRTIPLTASTERCSGAPGSMGVDFSIAAGFEGNKKARSFGAPSLSWRSYSSSICFRSSLVLTDTKTSSSSGIT